MGHLGFEPRTNRLKAEYSTAELMSQMGRVGFEPTLAEPRDLQSPSLNHSDTYPWETLRFVRHLIILNAPSIVKYYFVEG